MNEDQEKELIRRTLRGEKKAFEMIVSKYQQPLVNYIGRMVGEAEVNNRLFGQLLAQPGRAMMQFVISRLTRRTTAPAPHALRPDGVRRHPVERVLQLREGPHGAPKPDPVYGDQLQNFGVKGVVPAEGQFDIDWREREVRFEDGSAVLLRSPVLTLRDLGYGPLRPDAMKALRMAPPLVMRPDQVDTAVALLEAELGLPRSALSLVFGLASVGFTVGMLLAPYAYGALPARWLLACCSIAATIGIGVPLKK